MKAKKIKDAGNEGLQIWQDIENGKYFFILKGMIQKISLPEKDIAGPHQKIIFFENFEDNEKNEYYTEISVNGLGKFSIYKKGKYIGKYEPLDDRYHPSQDDSYAMAMKNVKEEKPEKPYHW